MKEKRIVSAATLTSQSVILGAYLLLLLFAPALSRAENLDYGSETFGGSSYVQHGPGPAYGGAYSDYGGNAAGLQGRFSASYGEYGAEPGYGRFGAGSSYGTGPLRTAGSGRAQGSSKDTGKQLPPEHGAASHPEPLQRKPAFP